MACVVGVGAGLIGSVGIRIAERYFTDLDAITREYIQGQITLDAAAERLQKKLPLHLVLTSGKFTFDALVIGSISYWIYELISVTGSSLADITLVSEFQGFLDLVTKVRSNILSQFNKAQSFGLDLSSILAILGISAENCPTVKRNKFIPAEIVESGFNLCCAGLIELGVILLSILGWIVHMVCKTGSFFWTEILKYFLVTYTAFYTAMKAWNMLTTAVANYFRSLQPRITPEDLAALNNRIINNIGRHNGNHGRIPPEDNLIPDTEAISSLSHQLDSTKNELKVMENKYAEAVAQLQNVETHLNEIRMPDFVDLPLTLEKINSGDTIEIRGQVIDIPPGYHAGMQINVFTQENNGDHMIKLPAFIVRIQEVPHRCFRRENQDLIYTATVDLSFIYPRAGRTLEVPSISSDINHILEIDEQTKIGNDTQLTIPSAGLPDPNDASKHGNIIIYFVMRMPTHEELLAMAAKLSNK